MMKILTLTIILFTHRTVSETGGYHTPLPEALHHGREDRPAQLRPLRLAGKA